MPEEMPPYAAIASHEVEDFDAWKAGFDANEANRVASGMVGHHLNRAEDNPNLLSIYFAVADIDKAKAFASSPNLAEVMKKARVITDTEFIWMVPKVDAADWARQLPAMYVRHSVADFDAWQLGYEVADDLRTAYGIVGHAANQSLDDPSVAIVYHQAESFDALRQFLSSSDLRAAMEGAGVTSEPEVTFYTSGWGKNY